MTMPRPNSPLQRCPAGIVSLECARITPKIQFRPLMSSFFHLQDILGAPQTIRSQRNDTPSPLPNQPTPHPRTEQNPLKTDFHPSV